MGQRVVVETKDHNRLDLAGWWAEAETERGNDEANAAFVVESIRSASGAEVAVAAVSNRAYRIEFADGALSNLPVTWNAFQANGAWTNLSPFTNRHAFMDTGAATNSGWPVATQRNYRIKVWLP